ncbi:iron ABC transporter permease [uncultured Methylobacterium sp.]|jgi:iron(III) transport system permease protein|uniref:ABC transporter permease n=1 Tax=uncultured Methylobacterium sp. TaxID=157278 RepID=UPI0026321806|nr:iron ABC transporter permease [uncultured Methylobacterium sp.]
MTSLTAPALGAAPAEAALPRATGRVDRPLQALTYGIVAVLVLAPIVPIVIQSFSSKPLYDDTGTWTLADYAELARDPAFWRATANTLLFGAASTLIAQAVGVWLAIVIGRTDLPGRRVLGAVATWPLFVSHLVLAFGWIIAYGPAGIVTAWLTGLIGVEPWNLYTLGGLSLAAGLSMAPLTYLYCVGAARTIDGSLENAARLAGAGPFRTLVTVTLPLLRPAILASTILNFVLAIELLVLPLLLGAPSGLEFLTTFIYTRGFEDSTPRHGMVAAVAVILFAVVTGLVLAQMRLVGDGRRFTTVGGKAARPRRLELGWAKWPTFGLVLAFDAFFVVAILGGLVLRGFTSVLSPFVPLSEALTLDNFRTIFAYEQYVRSIGNTIAVAVAGGVIGTALVAAAALVALRSDVPGRQGLAFLAVYPRAVPGILIGMGFLWAATWLPGLSLLQNTIWILVLAFVMRHLPTGWGAVQPALLQITRDHDRSARIVGSSWTRMATAILLPQMRPALAACFILLFVHCVKEYAAAVFLFAPGSEVMGTTMLTFWVQGENGAVAALATLQVAIVVAFMAVLSRLPGVRHHD